MPTHVAKMTSPNVDLIAQHYRAILKEVGADLEAEGLREHRCGRRKPCWR